MLEIVQKKKHTNKSKPVQKYFQEAKLILILDVCVSSKENPFDDLIKNYLLISCTKI